MVDTTAQREALPPEERLELLEQNDLDEMAEILIQILDRDGRVGPMTWQVLAFSQDDIEAGLARLEETLAEWGERRGVEVQSPGLIDE